MNPQLVQLFRAALDIAPSERGAYLDAHCGDPILRAQLDSLLLAAEQTERPLPEIELPVQLDCCNGFNKVWSNHIN